MSSQHQYGLLPCLMQGGVIHETAAKHPYLVRINRVFTNPTVSSTWRRGEPRLFRAALI